MNPTWHTLLLSDSSLPVGGFAHSSGLESCLVQGQISADNLNSFITQSLHSQFHVSVPFIKQLFNILYENNRNDKLSDICELDLKIHALIATSECQARASRTQGSAYLTLLSNCYEKSQSRCTDFDLILAFKKRVLKLETPGHFVICFSLVNYYMSKSTQISTLTQTVSLFLYLHMKSLVSSAIRLGIIGPYKGHSICLQLTSTIDVLITKLQDFNHHDGICINPVLEVLSAGHDRLYSRLFNS
jgi:urease accessory protein